MTLWSQGEAREGEAAIPKGERWKGEVSSPSKESLGKTSGLTFQLPRVLLYHGFGDASKQCSVTVSLSVNFIKDPNGIPDTEGNK
jgi:hypothetical protein